MENHQKRLLATSLMSLSLVAVEADASISSSAVAMAGHAAGPGQISGTYDHSIAQSHGSDAYFDSYGNLFSGSAQATAQTDYGSAQGSASSQNNGLVAIYNNDGSLNYFAAMSVSANADSRYERALTLYGTGKAVINYDLTFSLSTVGYGEYGSGNYYQDTPAALINFSLQTHSLTVAGNFYSGYSNAFPTGTAEEGISDPAHYHVTKVGDGTFNLHFSDVIDSQFGLGLVWGETLGLGGVAQNAAYTYDFKVSSIHLDPNMKLQDGFGKVLADTTAVPVPAALPLMFSGLGFMLWGSRRSRSA